MRIAIMGGPSHGCVNDHPEWPAEGWEAPIYRVPEFRWNDGPRAYGPAAMVIVDYRFWKKVGDTMIYKKPGYQVGSL